MTVHAPASKGTEENSAKDMSLAAASRAYDLKKYELAERTWRVLAERGDAEAQFHLADLYMSGPRAGELAAEAISWFRKAAEDGHPLAQNELGLAYRFGQDVPADAVEAAKWTERAAMQGVKEAQLNLATMYARGEGVAQDSEKARDWYARGASPEGPDSALIGDSADGADPTRAPQRKRNFGRFEDETPQPADRDIESWASDTAFVDELAEANDGQESDGSSHQEELTKRLMDHNQSGGDPLESAYQGKIDPSHKDLDSSDTLEEARQPSDRVEQEGLFDLGASYVERPEPPGSKLFGDSDAPGPRKVGAPQRGDRQEGAGSTASDVDSNGGPALRYLAGLVAYRERRFEDALRIWKSLAHEDTAVAQLALGQLFQAGRGVAQNLEAAAEWYEKAAAQGSAEAHYELALCFLFGRGVAKDRTAAMDHLQQAANLGSAAARSVVPELEREVGEPEIPSISRTTSNATSPQPTRHERTRHRRQSGSASRQGGRSPHRRRKRERRRRVIWGIMVGVAAAILFLAAGAIVYGRTGLLADVVSPFFGLKA